MGCVVSQGRTGALVEALVRLMKDVGVELKLNQQVSKVIVEGNKARGIRLESGSENSGLVGLSADPPKVYRI